MISPIDNSLALNLFSHTSKGECFDAALCKFYQHHHSYYIKIKTKHW